MRVFAVDPGPEHSGFVSYLGGRLADSGVVPNCDLMLPASQGYDLLAVEMVASYGMPVGREVFETCVWIGRLVERWMGEYRLVYRRDVKMHLCGSVRANDAAIRQALIDRYGPGREKAIGDKKQPGPLYGLKGDAWAALAVAVTAEAQEMARLSSSALASHDRAFARGMEGSALK